MKQLFITILIGIVHDRKGVWEPKGFELIKSSPDISLYAQNFQVENDNLSSVLAEFNAEWKKLIRVTSDAVSNHQEIQGIKMVWYDIYQDDVKDAFSWGMWPYKEDEYHIFDKMINKSNLERWGVI